ncbi:MAG: hypothetical protein ABIT08_07545 [Bacteroidia bacterium]
MTQKEALQLKMLVFLKNSFYPLNKEFCDGIPAAKIILKQLFLRIDKLENMKIKGGRGASYRDMKLHSRQTLCESAFLVSAGLLSFANITKNKVLRNAVKYCYSDLFRSVEPEMLNRCKQILRTAQRTKGLSFVDFDTNLLVELHDNIQKYENLMQQKDNSKQDAMKFNFLISKLLDECMQLIACKLTPLMKMLSKKYRVNSRNYFSAIRVIKQAGRKKKRNKKQQSKSKLTKPNILQQKSSEEILHRFAELAMAE